MNPSDYVNKTVIVGANYADGNDEVVEVRQFVGVVESADETSGIVIRLRNGEALELPPAFGAFQPAEPGDYTLTSTLEIVRDPDYLVVWTFRVS